ncbi:sensor histidine kinase [Megasphaera vaginalis (ex Bordigoni et al. 2020)]|uniref:sensor histidine kinase n=1 Tax=Megasphaera vaginalis (ex Bordigoni et al. 2020) TaxID=2045301 RepID=UPI000C7B24F7|nr:HAMP domain-containing sensor histidine kinase [Megasphaera vaginalis (ex Bordigoni et al. 2020)]
MILNKIPLRTRVSLDLTGFTLLSLIVLMVAVGLGFEPFYYEVQKTNMFSARDQIAAIYEENGPERQEQIDRISQSAGADVFIVDHGKLTYSSRPDRQVIIPRTQDTNVIVASPDTADTTTVRREVPRHIRELMAILNGAEPLENELDEVQSHQPKDSNGVRFFDLFSRIGDHTFLILSQPAAPMQKNIDIVQKFVFIFGLIWLLAAIVGAFIFSRILTKSLLELKSLAVRMAGLDFSRKWRSTRTDEIGQLGQSLNDLSDQLNTALTDLQASNDQLQDQLNKAQELEHMRKAFVSAVSHELKTPLAIIQGYAEGLESLVNDEEGRIRYCGIIRRETEKMNQLVLDLLNLSRLELGNFQLSFTDFDFTALAEETKMRFSRAIEEKCICLSWELPAEMTVNGDPSRLGTVLSNFLSNAIDYVPVGKRIDISAEMLADRYKIKIYNDGMQIPVEYQQRIWEPFYKVDTSRARDAARIFGGHGLGLGIVAALLKLHGTEYGVENEKDGVTFWFTVMKSK